MGQLAHRFDVDGVTRLSLRKRPALDRAMQLLTHLGDGEVWVMIGLLVLVSPDNGPATSVQRAIAFAAQLPLCRFFKRRSERRRPSLELPLIRALAIPPEEFSFPSGCTSAAFVMVVVVGLAVPVAFVPLLLLGAGVGMSRVYRMSIIHRTSLQGSYWVPPPGSWPDLLSESQSG